MLLHLLPQYILFISVLNCTSCITSTDYVWANYNESALLKPLQNFLSMKTKGFTVAGKNFEDICDEFEHTQGIILANYIITSQVNFTINMRSSNVREFISYGMCKQNNLYITVGPCDDFLYISNWEQHQRAQHISNILRTIKDNRFNYEMKVCARNLTLATMLRYLDEEISDLPYEETPGGVAVRLKWDKNNRDMVSDFDVERKISFKTALWIIAILSNTDVLFNNNELVFLLSDPLSGPRPGEK